MDRCPRRVAWEAEPQENRALPPELEMGLTARARGRKIVSAPPMVLRTGVDEQVIYEYQCGEGHVTELIRRLAQRDDPVECGCGLPAVKIMSLPARADMRRNYEGGTKIAPWSLPPCRDEETGEVLRNPDGSIKMQQVTVHSRREYLQVLKENGLKEAESVSDHLVQGGTARREFEETRRRQFDAEVESGMELHAEMKTNDDLRKKVIDAARTKGGRVDGVAVGSDRTSLSA